MQVEDEDYSKVKNIYYSLVKTASVRVRNILDTLRESYLNDDVFIDALTKMTYNDICRLKKCGRISTDKIMSIIDTLNQNSGIGNSEVKVECTPTLEIKDYDKSLDSIFSFKLASLSARGRHVVEDLLTHSQNSLIGLYYEVTSDMFNIRFLHNVGRTTIPELQRFFSDFVEMMRRCQDADAKIDFARQAKNILLKKIGIVDESLVVIQKTAEEIGYFPIFTAVQEFIKYCNNVTYQKIIQEQFWILKDKSYNSIAEVADSLNLTRERVRQLKMKVFELLTSFIKSLKALVPNVQCPYTYLMVDPSLEINRKENTNFNLEFVNYVLSIVYCDVAPCGDPIECFVTKPDKPSFFAAVPQESSKIFDFKAFVDNMQELAEGQYKDETKVSLKECIAKHIQVQYYEDDDYKLLEKACRSIIYLYFKFDVDLGQIIIHPNAYKPIPERIEAIIRDAGHPMTIDEIYNAFIDLYPEKYTDLSRLRAATGLNNNIVPISRSSTYSLKEWADEADKRGGTIREYVSEFLNAAEGHIATFLSVCNYVKQFRPKTSNSSISANLQAERTGMYSFYLKSNERYVGLTGNCEDNGFEELNEENNNRCFEESLELAEKFIEENHHFPFSSDVSSEEKRLNRFIDIQRRKSGQGDLAEHELELWNFFCTKYDCYKMNKVEYHFRQKFENYLTLKDRIQNVDFTLSPYETELLDWGTNQQKSMETAQDWEEASGEMILRKRELCTK